MSDEKKRCCKVCEKDPESLKKHGRRCDGCKAITCRHVCTSKGDEDFCPICNLRARKAEKAEAAKAAAKKAAKKPPPDDDDDTDDDDDAEEDEEETDDDAGKKKKEETK